MNWNNKKEVLKKVKKKWKQKEFSVNDIIEENHRAVCFNEDATDRHVCMVDINDFN